MTWRVTWFIDDAPNPDIEIRRDFTDSKDRREIEIAEARAETDASFAQGYVRGGKTGYPVTRVKRFSAEQISP